MSKFNVEDYKADRIRIQKTQIKTFEVKRAELLRKFRGLALISQNPVTEFIATFDGYGDSGQTYFQDPKDSEEDFSEVETFLSTAVDLYADWDWYNNEGGGGEIRWNITTNTIKIEGYYNEQISHSVDDKEF